MKNGNLNCSDFWLMLKSELIPVCLNSPTTGQFLIKSILVKEATTNPLIWSEYQSISLSCYFLHQIMVTIKPLSSHSLALLGWNFTSLTNRHEVPKSRKCSWKCFALNCRFTDCVTTSIWKKSSETPINKINKAFIM